MPVYLFTYHTYRSWMPDRPKGYVRRDQGILPPSAAMARRYVQRARHSAIRFDVPQRWHLIDTAGGVCMDKQWEICEATATPSHTHVLVGWRGAETWNYISDRLKRRLGSALSKLVNRPGPWFSRGRSRKRVRDRAHFEHLMKVYLPRHGPIRWTLRDKRSNS